MQRNDKKVNDLRNIGLCFDDVLMIPRYSEISSRDEVDLTSILDDNIKLDIPIISSPMDTITEEEMAIAMHRIGGLGIIHRYNTIEEQVGLVRKAVERIMTSSCNLGAAIGVTGDFLERAHAVVDAGANVLCIDTAHGHHVLMKNALEKIKVDFPSVHVMAGNVATYEAFNMLADWGADSIRVGIGGGSICSTRVQTGHGKPTLQSIMECAQSTRDVKIIADGGIRSSGDIVKALAAGADFVMLGSMLAGTDETPGDIFTSGKGKRKFKVYRGMASRAAQNEWRGRSSSPEGISTTIPYKGSTCDVLGDIQGGIRSGCSYSGVKNIFDLQVYGQFMRQTTAGRLESSTHILGRG